MARPSSRTVQDSPLTRLAARLPAVAWLVAAVLVLAAPALAWTSAGSPLAIAGTLLASALMALGIVALRVETGRQFGDDDRAPRTASTPHQADPLEHMPWREFEVLVSDSFRLRGYRVIDLVGGGPSHSFDLVLQRDRRLVLAHCRPGTNDRVSDETVRELDARRSVRGAAAAILVSAGRFSSSARQCGRDRKVTLLGGRRLRRQLEDVLELRRTAAGRRKAAHVARTPGDHSPDDGDTRGDDLSTQV